MLTIRGTTLWWTKTSTSRASLTGSGRIRPCCPTPSNPHIGLLPVGDFYDGKNDLGDDEVAFARQLEDNNANGRNGDGVDLAACVRRGRLQHRFDFCSGYDLEDWNGFLGLFRGLREAIKADDGLDWDEWKMTVLHQYKDDTNLQQLLL
ncbi:hypothetical protein F5Y19DRAFT_446803 [Xylariaceae sp. FL1651]|nr:hypothetical protein F5Y19DRAFT_446803 [Xylariaceae sp. FL1651]